MLNAILSGLWRTFEYVGLVSRPYWELSAEEEELVRRLDQIFKEDTLPYHERQGHVTQKTNNAIELNHRWIYQLRDTDVFSVGNYVAWKEYKTGGDIVIKDVVRVEEKETMQMTVNSVKIVSAEGPKRVTSVGAVFYLDKVLCDLDFRPELSDFVNIEGSCTKNDVGDSSSMIVKRVIPHESKLLSGKITSWDPSTLKGIVNDAVIFQKDVCDLTPTVGCSVICNCVKGDYDGGYKWRAYSMTTNKFQFPAKMFFVVEPIPAFDVVLGNSKTVELRVSNNSDNVVVIEDVNFFMFNKKVDVSSQMQLPYRVLAKTTVSWPVEVKGSKLGRQELKVEWKIGKKRMPIRTFITYNTVQQNLGETTTTTTRRRLVVPAPRQRRAPEYSRVPMKEYAVPEAIRNICPQSSVFDMAEVQMALQKLQPALGEGLSWKNYSEYMHTLLFLEEIEEEKMYDNMATRASLYRTKDYVVFNFPADSQYSKVVCGDLVTASKPWEKVKYEARVLAVSSIQLSLKFNLDFEQSMTPGALYDLEFKLNRMSNKRRHQAVDLVLDKLGAEWLFPHELAASEGCDVYVDNWYNGNLNGEQKRAVKSILAKKNLPYPYIIYGPPGTGKTVTVVETILQIMTHEKDHRILVAAPTNSAVDTLGLRLLEFDVFDKTKMVRLSGYNAYNSGCIAAELMDVAMLLNLLADPMHEAPVKDTEAIPCLYRDDIEKYSIILGTVATLANLNAVGLRKGFFTHIIIDEAGQCHEPDTLLPIALLEPNKAQLVLAGDPQQLGPVIGSMIAKQYLFEVSFLDRLTKCYLYRKKSDEWHTTNGYNPQLITRLVTNYRSLPKIVEVVGAIFYGSDLKPTLSPVNSREAEILHRITIHREATKDSMIFINVDTPEEQIDGSMSWFNQGEIAQVFFVLNFLYAANISPDDIGVITPYSLQVKKIYEYLDTLGAISPKVGSVEEFQGQERDVVILSLVRNNFGRRLSPFLTDSHRINVALSRARILNIIIGNRRTLVADGLWAQLISTCKVIDIVPAPLVEDTVD